MGLPSELSDVSDSFIISVVVSTARGISYVHHLIRCLFHSLIEARSDPSPMPRVMNPSRLAGLVVLADSLHEAPPGPMAGPGGGGCAFCLEGMVEGETIRRLPCRHVFHRGCVDRWLLLDGAGCPICRASVVAEERRVEVDRRIGAELGPWLAPY